MTTEQSSALVLRGPQSKSSNLKATVGTAVNDLQGALRQGGEQLMRGGGEVKSLVGGQVKKQWSNVRVAPTWAKTLVLTDWVSLLCMPPIIAGLVVFIVYLARAQSKFTDILDVLNATGGLRDLITAYTIFLAVTLPLVVSALASTVFLSRSDSQLTNRCPLPPAAYTIFLAVTLPLVVIALASTIFLSRTYTIFLAVTLPLVVIALAYTFALVYLEHRYKYRVQRDHALTVQPVQPIQRWTYRIFRGALIFLIVVEYLGLLWLMLSTAATAILLVAAYAAEAAANSAIMYLNNALQSANGALDWLKSQEGKISELAYQTNVMVNGREVNAGEVLDAILVQALNQTVVLERAGTIVTTTCPDFCINSYFLKDLLGLDSIDSCICSPDSIAEISQLANDAQGLLIAALIGIIIMVVAWIVLLMRLAATNDVIRVKYKLQQWLESQGYAESYPEASRGSIEGSTPAEATGPHDEIKASPGSTTSGAEQDAAVARV
ncbi:hypothetical protein N2152v2_010446 [Parachlorella kessleri]